MSKSERIRRASSRHDARLRKNRKRKSSGRSSTSTSLKKANNMISNLFSEYAIIEADIAALEAKKEQLRPHILKMMVEQGVEKLETDVGKFSVTRRKTWTYPEPVIELGEEFKAAKAKAESTGEATFEETESLRFTQIKL